MNMNNPVLWADFQNWPADLQKEYLDRRMHDFDCTMSGLAEIFDVDVAKLRKTLVTIGFDMRRFVAGRKMTKENRERMLAWIAEHRGNATPASRATMAKKVTKRAATDALCVDAIEAQTEVRTEPEASRVENCEGKTADSSREESRVDPLMKTPFVKMDFLGKLNPIQIANTLRAIAMDRDVKVSVTLEYQEG